MNNKPDNWLEKRPGHSPERCGDADEFWSDIGVDIESMSPKAQAVTGLVTGGVILFAAALLIWFTPFWWMVFIFGWLLFPALGIFARGVAGLADSRSELAPKGGKEKELLEALRRRGELTAAQAAMDTSLTVTEADTMFKELVRGGHLDVRVRGGGIFYSLWKAEGKSPEPEIESGGSGH